MLCLAPWTRLLLRRLNDAVSPGDVAESVRRAARAIVSERDLPSLRLLLLKLPAPLFLVDLNDNSRVGILLLLRVLLNLPTQNAAGTECEIKRVVLPLCADFCSALSKSPLLPHASASSLLFQQLFEELQSICAEAKACVNDDAMSDGNDEIAVLPVEQSQADAKASVAEQDKRLLAFFFENSAESSESSDSSESESSESESANSFAELEKLAMLSLEERASFVEQCGKKFLSMSEAALIGTLSRVGRSLAPQLSQASLESLQLLLESLVVTALPCASTEPSLSSLVHFACTLLQANEEHAVSAWRTVVLESKACVKPDENSNSSIKCSLVTQVTQRVLLTPSDSCDAAALLLTWRATLQHCHCDHDLFDRVVFAAKTRFFGARFASLPNATLPAAASFVSACLSQEQQQSRRVAAVGSLLKVPAAQLRRRVPHDDARLFATQVLQALRALPAGVLKNFVVRRVVKQLETLVDKFTDS